MRPLQHLGIRKICEANYSYGFYLPKEWVKKNGITSDKRVEVILMDDGSLLLRPAKV